MNITLVLVCAAIIRLWGVGSISLPFVLLGVVSLFISFKVVYKLTGDNLFSLIFILVLSFSPWHIQESRLVNFGMPMYLIFLFLLMFLVGLKEITLKKIRMLCIALLILVFSCSLTLKSQEIDNNIERQRNAIKTSPIVFRRVFYNKVTENFQSQKKIIFENLDFGNFFFKGHPRERIGREELHKLFYILIPFFIIGVFVVKKSRALILQIYSLFAFTFIVALRGRFADVDFPLIFALVFVITEGFVWFSRKTFKLKK